MDLELSGEGDLAIEIGDLALVTGTEAIAQHLRIRLRTFLGEWFLDQRVGLPYFEKIFVKNPSLPQINSAYRKTITTTPGVTELKELVVNVDHTLRQLSVTFSAETRDGPLEFDEELAPR